MSIQSLTLRVNSIPRQTTLIEPVRGRLPLSHGPYHYAPVVKSLRAEMNALGRLTPEVWDRTTPLVEPTTKANEEATPRSVIANFGDEIRDVFGLDRPFFIDPRWLGQSMVDLGGVRRRAVNHVLAECAAYELNCIPVLGLEDPPSLASMYASTVGFDRGACVRVYIRGALPPAGRTLEQQIDRVLDEVGLQRERAELFLDLGFIAEDPGFTVDDVRRRLASLGNLGRWRGLVLAGTVIPPDLSGWPEYRVRALRRHEMEIWLAIEAQSEGRRPSYSDYLIQHPRPPEGRPRRVKASIRYPTPTEMLIVRGTVTTSGAEQYRRLAGMITSRADYAGSTFSWGDSQIDSCARGLALPRTLQDWREIGTDRHLRLTSTTLARLEAA
jgi:hypothetical protein